MRKLLLVLLAHGLTMPLTATAATGGVEIVAHRGASGEAPENTLAAFKLAWEQKADAIETDLWLTKDGHIVCLHDQKTTRTTGVEADITQLTLAQVRALDAGKWKSPKYAGERIPTITEVLEMVPAGKTAILEIKGGTEVVGPLKQALASSKLTNDQLVIISFKQPVLAEVRKVMPEKRTYFLFDFKRDKKTGDWTATTESILSAAQKLGVTGVDVSFNPVSREVVNEAFAARVKQVGLELHVWTINDPALARSAAALGARSITTDRPGDIRAGL